MKKRFSEISIGTRFIVGDLTYEKTAEARGGCCNKRFNAMCLDTEEPHIFNRQTIIEIDDEK